MELMAPCGNLKSFLSAINSKTDSVYLGLKKFNARIPADNFTPFLLKKVVEYAHEKGVKVYLTLNIDIKENEIIELAEILEFLKSVNVDAIIIKDPSLILLINKFYKDKLIFHLSTQTAITNSYGVRFAKRINAKRVILARELEIDEIKECCKISNVECEMFIEGSMCFSVSGRCLASSWVGGKSGNRGVCTACCRVEWENNNFKDTFFSMKDLCLLEHLDKLKEIGVKALKIEGRLKNPNWVAKVVEIYKGLLYSSITFEKAKELYKELKKYSAREIKNGHIFDHSNLIGKNQEWTEFKKEEWEPIRVGEFNFKNEIIIERVNEKIVCNIIINDELSTLFITHEEKKKKARLKELAYFESEIKKQIEIRFNISVHINIKNEILISSSIFKKILDRIVDEVKKLIDKQNELPRPSEMLESFIKQSAIERNLRDKILGELPDKIIINLDQLHFFYELKKYPIKNIVVYINKLDLIDKIKQIKDKSLIISLPGILFEKEILFLREKIKELINEGFKNFEANSFCEIELLNEVECNKYLGIEMGVLNHLAANFYYSHGFNSLYASIEADKSILKALSRFVNGKIEALMFGKIRLFISRVHTDYFKENAIFKDKFNTAIVCHKENSLNVFVTNDDFCLIGENIIRERIFFDSLTADLRYYQNPVNVLKDIFSFNLNSYKIKDFNFSRRLI